ncbi:WGR domain-containing protein [Cognatishimia sp. SS12]|uniref:WGR domain-containing protein n=1 Tax=Cognatishimia sp. SS12 TaxID=2979465 RepID=UPI00232D032F|nr:WGR domain-containing protein [Cognatishimia sp. SS12]MDC0738017.1 WGR domain-containing protein [Cognatishimia sp. SS12]
MAVCLLYRQNAARRPRFYRVEIAYDLFDNITVFLEWGIAGRKGKALSKTFGNLREASLEADRRRQRALKRGFVRSGS